MTANSNAHSDEIELHNDEWFLAFGAVGYLKSSRNHLLLSIERNATLFIQEYNLLLSTCSYYNLFDANSN